MGGDAIGHPVETANAWMAALERADLALLAIGAVLIVAAIIHGPFLRRRGLLDDLALAPNRMQLDAMLLPVCVWAIAATVMNGVGFGVDAGAATSPAIKLMVGHVPAIAAAAACMWVAARTFDGGAVRFLIGRSSPAVDAGRGVGYFLAAMSICPVVYYAVLYVVLAILPDYPLLDHGVIEMLRTGDTPMWAIWLGTALIAPVCEEMFFRGIVQTTLANVFRSRWLAVTLAGAIFGAIHAGGGQSPTPHVVPALTVLGMLLGVLYLRSGSLIGPIVVHVMFNAKTLLWEWLLHRGS
ncbi:MAG: CPBP family intramembrane metalloprotease [Phycisphaerales bacterium]|nr:CPBP family intramembrane metalloprotease [Phycisphaerales bacterium]